MSYIKPIRPVLNTQLAIVSGLVFDMPLFEGFGTSVLELINAANGTLSGSGGPTWESKDFGKDVLFSDNTDVITSASVTAQNSLSAVSVECLVYPTGNNAALDARVIHKGPGQKYFDVGWESISSNTRFDWRGGFATTDVEVLTPTIPGFNQWYHLVFTNSNLSQTSGAGVLIYQNNVSQSLTINTTGAGAQSADSTDLGVGNRPASGGSTKGCPGRIAYVRYWNRVLSSTEVTTLYKDPFGIYLPDGYIRKLRPAIFKPG
jgi:hypothetical protein